MAKKNTPKPATARSITAKTADGAPFIPERRQPWIPVALALLVFCTGLTNEILGIDDHAATLDNPAVQNFTLFGHFNLGMYAPLTWACYAVAYAIGKDSPFWFHLLSLATHTFNTWLVYQLMLRLSNRARVALWVAIIFAIHPIQVESVSWIAGFSTPLYAMFYLLACIRYLDYTGTPEKTGFYWMSLLFFILACLAKSAAVTLPVTLIIFDLWRKPRLDRTRQVLMYVPFILTALFFGFLTIYSRQHSTIPADAGYQGLNIAERLLVLAYTPVFYWVKMLFPFSLNIYYAFNKVNGHFPWTYYAAPAVLAGVVFAGWHYREKAPWAWWGLLLFFANIFVMLPFRPLGTFEMIADHYNYLALIGIAFVLVEGWLRLQNQSILQAGGIIWIVLLAFLSLRQIRIWKDTVTVVSNAIDNGYVQNGLMYSARAQEFGNQGKLPAAIQDFNKAIEINPKLYDAYKYRGDLYGVAKQYEKSVADLNIYLQQHPEDAEHYYNRGLSLLNLKRVPEAISDFNRTIELNPDFYRAYRGRGKAYIELGDTVKGNADLQEYEKRNSRAQ